MLVGSRVLVLCQACEALAFRGGWYCGCFFFLGGGQGGAQGGLKGNRRDVVEMSGCFRGARPCWFPHFAVEFLFRQSYLQIRTLWGVRIERNGGVMLGKCNLLRVLPASTTIPRSGDVDFLSGIGVF